MKTYSLAEFQALAARNDWRREQDLDIGATLECEHEEVDDDGEPVLTTRRRVCGNAARTSTLDGISITYVEGFAYDEFTPDSLSTGTEGVDEPWRAEGITVIDEDGDALTPSQLADYLPEAFKSIDYDELQIAQVTDIDIDEDSDMETITIEIDNGPDIRFTGEKVARVASSSNQAMGSAYSGQVGRWTELTLYKTQGGKFVCHQIGRTQWQGERDRFSGKVCETLDEVREFFGHRWLAKDLYVEAGIEDVVEVA